MSSSIRTNDSSRVSIAIAITSHHITFSPFHPYHHDRLSFLSTAPSIVMDQANCFPNLPLSSSSLWLDDNAFDASVPILLAQIATIVAISQFLHTILRRFGQPVVVSQVITGLILGPSFLSRFSFFRDVLFSERSWVHLDMLALVGLVLFRFVIGLKTDVATLKTTREKAVMVAIASRATPNALVALFNYILYNSLPEDILSSDILTGVSVTWTLSSFIVITCLLNELNLLSSKVGRLAVSASLLDNLVDIIYHLVSSTVNNTGDGGVGTWVGVVSSFVALIMFMITVARPVSLWIIRRTPEGEQLDEKYFVVILVLALGCGLFSEMIGYHAGVGMLLLGLALPTGPPLGYTLVERLEGVITTLSIPVVMAKPGFFSDMNSLVEDVNFCGYLEFFVLLTVVGKFVGVLICALTFCGMQRFEAIPLALIMCTKGFYEAELILTWHDQQMIDLRIATTFTISIAFIAGVTTPIIKALYRPSAQYVDHDWRTIQHSKLNSELQIMACVHHQENVAPLLKLLSSINASPDSPIHVVVLHLVQLVGRATTVLAPYTKNNKNAATGLSESDRIVNAFVQFAQNRDVNVKENNNSSSFVSIQPFVSISPHATMHDDVCTLALDKRVSLIILPFHKATMVGSTQIVNVNVVGYAPCSVAILVVDDEKNSSKNNNKKKNQQSSFEKVAVYFLGGADDREALCLSMNMADNPKVSVTVFRFRGKDDPVIKYDEELLERARFHGRIEYREEEVHDGEHLTTVIQSTNHYYDLLVVGRRDGIDCPLTSGMSAWSECPELGVIGDVLASKDFSCEASVLVVQQQLKVGAVRSTAAQAVIDD